MKLITGIINGRVTDEERLNEIFKSFDTKKVEITVKKWTEKRSSDQNRGLWRWNKLLSDFTGYTEEEIHYLMCGELYGWKELEIAGHKITRPNKTTSMMNTSEFSHHIMLYELKARELFDYNLPPFSYEDGE